MPYQFSFTFRDAKGYTARVVMYNDELDPTIGRTAARGVEAVIQNLSNAAYQASGGVVAGDVFPLTYGSPNIYQSVSDKAVFIFIDGDGNTHRYKIPAPKAALFLPDGETINPSNGDVSAFVAAMFARRVSSRSGVDLAMFLGGYRSRSRQKRRLTSATRNPSLTGPG